jgi:hypothetical protein
MSLFSFRAVSFAAVSVVWLSGAAFAQSAKPGPAENLHGLTVRQTHGPETPTPFPLGVSTGRTQTLEFRTPEQMTAADKSLVAGNEEEIVRRAELQGFRLDGAESGEHGWGYEQAVCPVFPNHVVLEYSRDNGAGDVTLFSVVVPRGEGHVRVIPVRRRGYSLWTPASSNALTLNDFNHMVKEEPAGLSADWLTLGLCYGALAGGHVRAGLIAEAAADEHYPLVIPATLAVSRKGGADVRFADTSAKAGAKDWTLTFAQSGRLLKVTHKPARELVERPVVGQASEVKGRPVKESALDITKPAN